jgi:hypothetical protein
MVAFGGVARRRISRPCFARQPSEARNASEDGSLFRPTGHFTPGWPAYQRAPDEQRRGHQNDREHHFVDSRPAKTGQQRAGGERADRHRAEDQKIVERLNLVAFVRIVTGLASTGVRRLHDRGKTGYWLALYYLLPSMMSKNAGMDTVGLIFSLVTFGILIWGIVDLGILRGEAGSNAFGPAGALT